MEKSEDRLTNLEKKIDEVKEIVAKHVRGMQTIEKFLMNMLNEI